MAAITFLGPISSGQATFVVGSNFASLQDGGSFLGATEVCSWICGTSAIGTYALQAVNYSGFGDDTIEEGTSVEPDVETGLNNTQSGLNYGDSWCTQIPYSGFFAAGTWELNVWTLRGTDDFMNAGASRIRMRIWQGSDPTGAGAVEITSGSLVFPINSDVLQTVILGTYLWSAPQIELNNEYLFFQVGMEITTASTDSTQTISVYWGDGYTNIVSTDFEPAAFPVGLAATCTTPYRWPTFPQPMAGYVNDGLLFDIALNPDHYESMPRLQTYFSGIEFITFQIFSNAALSGVVGTFSPGTAAASIVESYNEHDQSVAAAGGVGVPTFNISSSVSISGLSAAAELGGAYALLNPTVDVTGLAATTALGTAAVDGQSYAVVGVHPMRCELGYVTFDWSFSLTGISGTCSPGAVRPVAAARAVSATGRLGTPRFTFDYALPVGGLSAIAVLGIVQGQPSTVLAPAVIAYGQLGTVYIDIPRRRIKQIAVQLDEETDGADSSTARTERADIYAR